MIQTEFLRDLVARPSPSGSEQGVAQYVGDRCSYFGHEVIDVAGNVIVHILGADATKAVVLNGHMDTVPVVEGWQTDPFRLIDDPQDRGRVIGLGSTDMKAGLATELAIANDFATARPPVDVWLTFSSKEETDSSGSIAVARWFSEQVADRYHKMGGLILEPTDAAFVGVGSRSAAALDVVATGGGGHASQDFGYMDTAVTKLASLLADLPRLQQNWTRYEHDILGRVTANVVNMHAGMGAQNIVPTTAAARIDLRTTPAMNRLLPAIVEDLAEEYDLQITLPWKPADSLCYPRDHIYQVAQWALPGVDFAAFPGATDQFAFQEHGIPMLIYGPGSVREMHMANEVVRLSAMQTCLDGVRAVIRNF